MDNREIEKSRVFDVDELAAYVSNSTVMRTIVKKNTGIISMNVLDSGQERPENRSPFDTFVHVIDGTAEIDIDDKLNILTAGQCLIIPAHSRCVIRATVRFKMISTIIKSGYEDL